MAIPAEVVIPDAYCDQQRQPARPAPAAPGPAAITAGRTSPPPPSGRSRAASAPHPPVEVHQAHQPGAHTCQHHHAVGHRLTVTVYC